MQREPAWHSQLIAWLSVAVSYTLFCVPLLGNIVFALGLNLPLELLLGICLTVSLGALIVSYPFLIPRILAAICLLINVGFAAFFLLIYVAMNSTGADVLFPGPG